MTRNDRRFARQIDRLERAMPRLGATLKPGSRVRLPLAIVLILGGLLGFLPVLGFWMLPLGLVLLAIDWPVLRPLASGGMVRFRQVMRQWGRRLRNRWRRLLAAARPQPPGQPPPG